MQPEAKIILDSISPRGVRLTTFTVTLWRPVLAEFNTHRVLSRNSASSRAIPIQKRILAVLEAPAVPLEWGRNQKGMQADELLSAELQDQALDIWLSARDSMVVHAKSLLSLGVHKQIVNRLLEPWVMTTILASSTEMQNFFDQRCTPATGKALAQPEIRAAADAIKAAMEASHPTLVHFDYWHTPFIQPDEQDLPLDIKMKISVARCARVSYLTHEGKRDVFEDLAMYDRLRAASPRHESPLEHVATPSLAFDTLGNFSGWAQLRHSKPEDLFSSFLKETLFADESTIA